MFWIRHVVALATDAVSIVKLSIDVPVLFFFGRDADASLPVFEAEEKSGEEADGKRRREKVSSIAIRLGEHDECYTDMLPKGPSYFGMYSVAHTRVGRDWAEGGVSHEEARGGSARHI